jgi:uncharacterized protein
MKHLCPICRRPTDSETDADFPFCSERCRLVDLGNWASERYIVSEPVFEEDELEDGKFDLRLDEPDTGSRSDSDSDSDLDSRRDRSSGNPPDKHDSER